MVDTQVNELVKVRGARKVTAKRMLGSVQNTAPVTLTRYADAEAMQQFRAKLLKAAGVKVSLNDIVLHSVARALRHLPEINARFHGDHIERCSHVNLGFAVDTGRALLVPVLNDADRMSIEELAAATADKIERAKEGKLVKSDMEGATFSVSNLGSLGVHWFTPVINTPEVGILGVGAIQEMPNGSSRLSLSLTFDHQALDGAAAARALAAMANAMETVNAPDEG